jgi:hypothetical protein
VKEEEEGKQEDEEELLPASRVLGAGRAKIANEEAEARRQLLEAHLQEHIRSWYAIRLFTSAVFWLSTGLTLCVISAGPSSKRCARKVVAAMMMKKKNKTSPTLEQRYSRHLRRKREPVY